MQQLPETLITLNCRACASLTHVGVETIATRCPNIIELDLGLCSFKSPLMDCLVHIAHSCKSLQRLSMFGWGRLSDQMMYTIIKGCSRLKMLDISRTPNITAAWCSDILSKLELQKQFTIINCILVLRTLLDGAKIFQSVINKSFNLLTYFTHLHCQWLKKHYVSEMTNNINKLYTFMCIYVYV